MTRLLRSLLLLPLAAVQFILAAAFLTLLSLAAAVWAVGVINQASLDAPFTVRGYLQAARASIASLGREERP